VFVTSVPNPVVGTKNCQKHILPNGSFWSSRLVDFPVELLQLIKNLFSCCFSCVKWDDILPETFPVSFVVRQGSVLSPFMFALYLDGLASVCDLNQSCSIFLYADDILLIEALRA